MVNHVDRNTTLCVSLAACPSNHGVRFHNWLYAELGLNFLYKAIAPTDIEQAVAGIRGLDIRGAGVSMPYKAAVIPLIDHVDPSAARIQAVNTIVNDGGVLTGYNTDYSAVSELLASHAVDTDLRVAVRGSGGMAKAVVAAITDYGMGGTVVARNAETGSELAEQYGWAYSPEVPTDAQMLVNVTPLGMAGTDEDVICDVVAFPVSTPLIQAAQQRGIPTINGGEIVALQAAQQFELYTGVRPSDELIEAAERYSQQG